MRSKNKTVNLALAGLMGALVFVATVFFKVQIPVGGDKTMIGLANVFCILSGLLLGPVYGGLAAGVGSFLFDITNGWASSAPVTLVTKFAMAWICGLIAWGGDGRGEKLSRVIVGAVAGSVSYSVLYLAYSAVKELVLGDAAQTVQMVLLSKLGATATNAVFADIIAVPLYFAVRRALARSFPEARGSR
ncbi:ECF transporter S component [Caproicibacter fermentans]|uniref:ECF transporter S component n=1 Tax=Caproicibacter fermentans TaxID=2576756 RepID=A0A7G8T9T3_9FIRM|nr:ECF transporter S component [Caproicibacter fermentans]QNK40374.1 ECF transporter S component [Caproicibacter fermentans]